MSFAQLRALVASSIEPHRHSAVLPVGPSRPSIDVDDDDPEQVASEFEERATTYRPTRPARLTTLDDVIASLLRGN